MNKTTRYWAAMVALATFGFAVAGGDQDAFEEDDTPEQASQVMVSTDIGDPTYHFDHLHTFHDQGDTDWVYFPVIGGGNYVLGVIPNTDESLQVTVYTSSILTGPGTLANCATRRGGSLVSLFCSEPTTEVLYAEIKNASPSDFGPTRGFEVQVENEALSPFDPVLIQGTVTDSVTGAPVSSMIIRDDQNTPTLTLGDGSFALACGRGITVVDTVEGQLGQPDAYTPLIVDVISFFEDPQNCPTQDCVDFGQFVPGQVLTLNLRVKPFDLLMRTGFEDGEDFEGGASN